MNHVRRGVVAASLMAAAAATCGAAVVGSSVEQSFRQSERDIPSLYLLNGLNLSPDQNAALFRTMLRLEKVDRTFEEKRWRLVSRTSHDARALADDLIRSAARGQDVALREQLKAPVYQRLGETMREVNEAAGEWQQQREAAADAACDILSDGQKAILRSFVPCFIPPSDFRNPERVGQAAGDTSVGEAILGRLRAVSADALDSALDLALDRLVPYTMQTRKVVYSEQAERDVREELAPALRRCATEARRLGDADWQLGRKNLAARITPSSGDSNDPVGIRWKVLHYVLNKGVSDVIALRGGPGERPPIGVGTSPGAGEESDAKRIVRIAMLVRGLNLSDAQVVEFRRVVQKAIAGEQELRRTAEARMREALEPYAQLRGALATGIPTPEGEHAASSSHQRVRSLLLDDLTREQLKWEGELDRMLSVQQVEFLSDREDRVWRRASCERDVQSAMAGAGRLLSEVRRMPPARYQQERDTQCRAFIAQNVKQAGTPAAAVDGDAELKRIGEILDRTRKLDQVEYSRSRENLSAELCVRRSRPRDPTYGAHYERGEPVPMVCRTTLMLFSDTAIDILNRMIESRG